MSKVRGLLMFCPKCGTLGFPDAAGNISCTNYKCGYNGPVGGVKIGNKEVELKGTIPLKNITIELHTVTH